MLNTVLDISLRSGARYFFAFFYCPLFEVPLFKFSAATAAALKHPATPPSQPARHISLSPCESSLLLQLFLQALYS